MITIDMNGIIKVNRGDNFEISLKELTSKNIFNFDEFDWCVGDLVLFDLTEANKPFEHFLLRKECTFEDLTEDHDIIISFNHMDTNWLAPCTYFYEVKLLRPTEQPDDSSSDSDSDSSNEEENKHHPHPDYRKYKFTTIIPKRKFVIL